MSQKEAWTIRQKMLGGLLRQARKEAGKTLKECGGVLGLSSGAVSAIEHGRRAISLPELEVLAYYLRVPLDRLLSDNAESTRTPDEELPNSEMLTLRRRIVGALLRKASVDQNLSAAELAKKLGISQKQLSQYELGEKPIPLVELEALAEILELPMSYFLDEGVGPLGQQQRRDKEWQQFAALPDPVRTFVAEPTNLAYLQLAMSLSAVPAEGLRDIAGSLFDITL